MQLKNTPERYGAIAKGLHWLVALLVLVLLPLGFIMVSLELSPFKLALYFWHKSFGTLVLVLAALRLAWRLYNRRPAEIASHRLWERRLAGSVHVLLYAGLILMPLSGWLMSSAADFSHSFFGLFNIPDLVGRDEALFRQMRFVHQLGAYFLLAAILLHGAGAFKHHFIDRDETLKRMLPALKPQAGALFVLGLFLLFAGGTSVLAARHLLISDMPAQAEPAMTMKLRPSAISITPEPGVSRWTINAAESRIGFTVAVQGQDFEGQFNRFSGDIRFDPERLERSRVDMRVDIASVQSGSAERDQYIRAPAWLDAARFPQARFAAAKFEKTGPDQYLVHGDLTLGAVTGPLAVPFSLSISPAPEGGQRAEMRGRFEISRLEYGIGKNEWANPDLVAHTVMVNVFLVATR